MLRIISLTLTVAVLAGVLIILMGYRANPSYQQSITFIVSYSTQDVWRELLNIEEVPKRKKDVESVDILEELGTLVAWRENLKDGGYRIYRMNGRDEEKTLILELTDSSYELKGVWVFYLKPHGNETEVTISEDSTLTDIKRRGYRVIFGREVDLLIWQKYLKVGLFQSLLDRP